MSRTTRRPGGRTRSPRGAPDAGPRSRTPRGARRTAAERLYDRLLALVPDREAGTRQEMREVFGDAARDAAGRGVLAHVRLWAIALVDLVRTALALRRPRPRMQLDALIGDLRLGARALRTSPGFSAVVVLTLGLAIGVNSTIFSLGRMLMQPLGPIADDRGLVVVRGANPELNRPGAGISLPDLEDLEVRATTFAALAAFRTGSFTLTGADEPARLGAAEATANFLTALGLETALGRGFAPAGAGGPESAGGADQAVAVLGHGAWQRHFGADPAIVGRDVILDGARRTIIGVLPESFEAGAFGSIDVWTVLSQPASTAPRDQRDLFVIGRLAPGATLAAANAELQALSDALEREFPATNTGWRVRALSFLEGMVGVNAATVLALMAGSATLILVIACANVANLMMARGARRRQELAVRQAIGARRGRLVRQLLTESAVLAVLSAAAGVLLAHGILRGLVALGRGGVPLFQQARVDAGVLGFALALALLTPLAFGVIPALRSTRRAVAGAAGAGRGGGVEAAPSRLRPRAGTALATLQVALAVVLLVVASLATRSVIALVGLELGFRGDDVLTLRVELPRDAAVGPDAAGREAVLFFEQALAGIGSVAAIERAAWASRLPLEGGAANRSMAIEGRPAASEADVPWVSTTVVTPGYFETLGIPLRRGRLLEAADNADGRPVALISEAAVQRYGQGELSVGARVKLGGLESDSPWLEVVGVVGDTRNPDADQPPVPQLYLPLAQSPTRAMALVARTRPDLSSNASTERIIEPVRAAIWSIAPDQPIDDVRTMGEVLYNDFAGDISAIGLMIFFALVALALSTAGVYAVIAANVSRRQREIGIRMALGARQGRVMAMVLRQGAAPVVAGLMIGLAGALAVARLIAGALFGVGPRDPATFIGVPALLLAVGLAASLMPALRATRVDPCAAVRAE